MPHVEAFRTQAEQIATPILSAPVNHASGIAHPATEEEHALVVMTGRPVEPRLCPDAWSPSLV